MNKSEMLADRIKEHKNDSIEKVKHFTKYDMDIPNATLFYEKKT